MKHLFTLLALTITFSMNAQIFYYGTNNSGPGASAFGINTTAIGNYSTAIGAGTQANGDYSTAMGIGTQAIGDTSTAMGASTTANGSNTTAMGRFTTASDFGSTVIGQYNSSGSTVTSNATAFNTANTAFVIGNGTGTGVDASDAFKVMFNGDAYVSGNLDIQGTITGLGILSSVTEGSYTGVRLSTENSDNHGSIGSHAVDLSYSQTVNETYGATGAASTAMGFETTAIGLTSTAMGVSTTANGNYSTAMGVVTTASDYGSTVIGQYNSSGSTVTSNATAFDTANTAFVIGNGTGTGADASDAFKVMFNGDAYVSSSLYLGDTKIDSTADELNLLSGVTSLASGILSSVTEGGNIGVRLSTSDVDNHGDIGANAVDLSRSIAASTTRGATGAQSTAMGDGTTASGYASTAMGYTTTASASQSTAIGNNTTASGFSSTAMGRNTSASATDSTAMGYGTTASDESSTAMGENTLASGYASTAMGRDTQASGLVSTAMGDDTTAIGDASTAMGNGTTASGLVSTAMGYDTTASGASSTAMGESTTASDFGSTVIGQYNLSGSTVTNSATIYNTDNTAFVIGNGASSGSPSDAFKVMFNGNATLSNDLTVEGDIVISSDARLKANIVSLGSTIARLLLIDGKSYTMKKDGKQKIGVLAQDIQKVFPELVSTDDRDMLAVNYQGLVPVLINALKEQDGKMKEQDGKMKEQEKRLERLEAIISKMDK